MLLSAKAAGRSPGASHPMQDVAQALEQAEQYAGLGTAAVGAFRGGRFPAAGRFVTLSDRLVYLSGSEQAFLRFGNVVVAVQVLGKDAQNPRLRDEDLHTSGQVHRPQGQGYA